MALSFPPSPAIGDIYLQWQWNGSAWGPISGGSSGGSVSIAAGTGITVSPSPLTGTGTVALSTPVAISAGGTNATTAGAAFNAIAASGGTMGGNLSVTGNVTINGSSATPLNITTPSGNNCNVYLTVTGLRTVVVGVNTLGNYEVYDSTASATRIRVDTTGACSASSTWAVISDARLKEDVQPYTRGLADILPLEPIMYRWNGKGGVPADGEVHYGLAAQQVEETMPELIREHEYVPAEDARADDEPMTLKTYSPTDLTFALINACKELHERLTAAEAKLTSQGAGH